MNPKVSVIIINYNTKKLTSSCVKSVKKYLKNSQIILVDNASTDGSKDFFSKDKNIEYIYNQNNLGFSKANNIGALAANSDLLLFLNSDTQIFDYNINQAVDYYTNNNIGILAPKLLNTDSSTQPSCFKEQSITNALKEYVFKQKFSFSKYFPETKKPLEVENVVGAAILISKKIFNLCDKWNEKYFMYFEDFDLCRKVKKLNKKIIYFPPWTIYHHHGSSKSFKKNDYLISSSKRYHGLAKYYLLTLILWLGQKI